MNIKKNHDIYRLNNIVTSCVIGHTFLRTLKEHLDSLAFKLLSSMSLRPSDLIEKTMNSTFQHMEVACFFVCS